MNNLFVLHTQYNLILAAGLVATKYKRDNNDLVLFRDFNLSKEVYLSLRSLFDSFLILPGTYPKGNTLWKNKIRIYVKAYARMKEFLKRRYQQVFIVEDICIPEQRIMQLTSICSNPEYIGIEDGMDAYVASSDKPGGLSKNTYTLNLRKIIFKYIIRLGRFYHYTDSACFGLHPLIKSMYALNPEYVRDELRSKELMRISSEVLKKGIEMLYTGVNIPYIRDNSIIVFIDKLCRYKRGDRLIYVLEEMLHICAGYNVIMYCKMHPGEEQTLPAGITDNLVLLPSSIPAEAICAYATGRSIIIAGASSTSLHTAAKMGLVTISFSNLLDDISNEFDKNFEKFDIKALADIEELKNTIAKFFNLSVMD